jgi:hypothetical protein
VKGEVTYVESKESKDKARYLQVKVMQGDRKGNVYTIAVRIWDPALVAKGYSIGDSFSLDECSVQAYKMGNDRIGLSVDKW